MGADPTQRFSSRAEAYSRYRPSYPTGVRELLVRECGLTAQSRIADIGSGTGLLATLFLDFGCEVIGVEPNAEMRRAGEQMLADRPRFRSVDGRAEATTLSAGSVNLVTAGQAFHWFDPPRAREEFRRILRPPGWAALIWNERQPVPGLMAGYEELVRSYGPEERHVDDRELEPFFGKAGWRLATVPNLQVFDFEGLRGRFLSSSYAPLQGTPRFETLMAELLALFEKHERSGRVTMVYQAEIYFGGLLV